MSSRLAVALQVCSRCHRWLRPRSLAETCGKVRAVTLVTEVMFAFMPCFGGKVAITHHQNRFIQESL